MVYEKSETKKGNIMFTLEDLSGVIKVVVSQNSPGFAVAKDTQLDEIIGVYGTLGNKLIFGNTVIYPDVTMATEIKNSPDEVYAVVPSDPQVGSKLFQPERFENFIQWINGNHGSPHEREIAKKVGYVLMPGDVIEGIGIFPGQEDELDIPDIYDQYKALAAYIDRIPKHIKIVICSGNHDGVRIAEPQPRIYEDFAPELYAMSNVHMVTNPSIITMHKSEEFDGFSVLFYHGFSYVYYCDNVQSIKDSGMEISDRTGIIMKYLLQRRHLAPVYGSTRALPNPDEDCHVIEEIPDFFLSGHIHKAVVTSYRGVQIIVGSCFQGMSSYQEKFGHTPVPGQVPLINLKTRKVSMLEF
jgi:DNA polymerase II small subunit